MATRVAPVWMSAADVAALRLTTLDEFSPLGAWPLVFVPLDATGLLAPSPLLQAITVGVDREGALPAVEASSFDLLLTTRPSPPRPWVHVAGERLDATAEMLADRVSQSPLSATTLAQIMRLGDGLSFAAALAIESLAYSTLLGGPEFSAWRAHASVRPAHGEQEPLINTTFENETFVITLARPARHNAFSAALRDQLVAALEVAAQQPRPIVLQGDGPSFCSGGDLDEFGTTPDPATAHAVRIDRSVAARVHALAARLHVRLHGACIGAGIEIAAAAGRVTSHPGARFILPEVAMGLIPGAGGTVTIPCRIGRHRAFFMALAGEAIGVETAHAWGLIDAIEAA